jgi:hypothetical protein
MQALSLAKDCYRMKLEILDSETIIDKAILTSMHRYYSYTLPDIIIVNGLVALVQAPAYFWHV